METVIGTLLFVVAVNLFIWSAIQYRQTTPASWTKAPLSAVFLALFVVSALMFSITIVCNAYIGGEPAAITMRDIWITSIIVAAGAFATYGLAGKWKRLATQTTGKPGTRRILVNPPANDTGRNPPDKRGGRTQSRRKAA